jgi:prepilin-type N-terminal cleavage/methylation domain-containing protein
MKNQKGFTLIETMMALAILAITVSLLGSMHFASMKNNRAGNMTTEANMFARDKIEELWNVRAWTLDDGIWEDQSPNGVYIRTWSLDNYGPKSKKAVITVTWRAPLDKRRSVRIESILRGPIPKVQHF